MSECAAAECTPVPECQWVKQNRIEKPVARRRRRSHRSAVSQFGSLPSVRVWSVRCRVRVAYLPTYNSRGVWCNNIANAPSSSSQPVPVVPGHSQTRRRRRRVLEVHIRFGVVRNHHHQQEKLTQSEV